MQYCRKKTLQSVARTLSCWRCTGKIRKIWYLMWKMRRNGLTLEKTRRTTSNNKYATRATVKKEKLMPPSTQNNLLSWEVNYIFSCCQNLRKNILLEYTSDRLIGHPGFWFTSQSKKVRKNIFHSLSLFYYWNLISLKSCYETTLYIQDNILPSKHILKI